MSAWIQHGFDLINFIYSMNSLNDTGFECLNHTELGVAGLSDLHGFLWVEYLRDPCSNLLMYLPTQLWR